MAKPQRPKIPLQARAQLWALRKGANFFGRYNLGAAAGIRRMADFLERNHALLSRMDALEKQLRRGRLSPQDTMAARAELTEARTSLSAFAICVNIAVPAEDLAHAREALRNRLKALSSQTNGQQRIRDLKARLLRELNEQNVQYAEAGLAGQVAAGKPGMLGSALLDPRKIEPIFDEFLK